MNIEPVSSDEYFPATFDYTDESAAAIVSLVITITVMAGVDPDTATMLQGAPLITGGVAVQLIKNAKPGVQYNAHCLATLADGSRLARDYRFKGKAPGA